jgi:hypothetical protein
MPLFLFEPDRRVSLRAFAALALSRRARRRGKLPVDEVAWLRSFPAR